VSRRPVRLHQSARQRAGTWTIRTRTSRGGPSTADRSVEDPTPPLGDRRRAGADSLAKRASYRRGRSGAIGPPPSAEASRARKRRWPLPSKRRHCVEGRGDASGPPCGPGSPALHGERGRAPPPGEEATPEGGHRGRSTVATERPTDGSCQAHREAAEERVPSAVGQLVEEHDRPAGATTRAIAPGRQLGDRRRRRVGSARSPSRPGRRSELEHRLEVGATGRRRRRRPTPPRAVCVRPGSSDSCRARSPRTRLELGARRPTTRARAASAAGEKLAVGCGVEGDRGDRSMAPSSLRSLQ